MEFLLPDERTMDVMRREFEALNIIGRAKAMTSAIASCEADTYCKTSADSAQNSRHMCKNGISGGDPALPQDGEKCGAALPTQDLTAEAPSPTSVSRLAENALSLSLLYLYFIRNLGYNSGYGTQIYDASRGLGGLRSVPCPFAELNSIGSRAGEYSTRDVLF